MNPQTKNPHGLGAGLRKLASWAHWNATTIGNALLLILLAVGVIWQGVANGH